MSFSSRWNSLSSKLFRRNSESETSRKRRLTRGLLLELLERRDAPATYAWDAAGNLSVVLGSGESLTVTGPPTPGSGSTTFSLTGGTPTFTPTGTATATGNLTSTLTFASGDNIGTAISFTGGVSTAASNVTFAGGSIQATTITVNIGVASTSSITFGTAATNFGNSTVNLTAKGAGITAAVPVTASGILNMSASGQAISLGVAGTDLGTINVTASTNDTFSDLNTATIGTFAATTGSISLVAGILQTSASNVISDVAILSLASGTTFDLNGKTETIGALSGAGAVTLGSGALTTAPTSGTFTLSGNISGTGGSLIKAGLGTEVLAGTNTYDTGTTINAGILQFNSAAAIAGTGANVLVNVGGVAATGPAYQMDQAFLSRIVSSSAGVLALGVTTSNNLDFSAATGANLTAAAARCGRSRSPTPAR